MIKAIMAVDHAWGIGKDGKMPWPPIKEDLKQFKEKTTGNIVVMGSKTWNSDMPAPLPNRYNYVITNSLGGQQFVGADGLLGGVGNIADQIVSLDRNTNEDVWIIGGASIIKQCMSIIEEFHLTVVWGIHNCDTVMDISEELHANFDVTEMTVTPHNTYYVYKRMK